MRVSIHFRGPISQRLQEGSIEVEADAESLQSVLKMILEKAPYLMTIWASVEEMDRDALILVNNVDIGLTGGLGTVLKEGDVVSVLPLVHGG